jgi:hypothetical protein
VISILLPYRIEPRPPPQPISLRNGIYYFIKKWIAAAAACCCCLLRPPKIFLLIYQLYKYYLRIVKIENLAVTWLSPWWTIHLDRYA